MKAMAKSGPIPLLDERRFIPRSLGEAKALNGALIHEAGLSRTQAAGLVMFLAHIDEVDHNDSFYVRLSEYRRFLAKLGEPPWERDPSRFKGAYTGSDADKPPRRKARFGRGDRGKNRVAAAWSFALKAVA